MNILMSKEENQYSAELQERSIAEVSECEIFIKFNKDQLQEHGAKKVLVVQAYNEDFGATWSVYFARAQQELATQYLGKVSLSCPPALNQSKLKYWTIAQTVGSMRFGSHYDYLNAVWEEFHAQVYGVSASDSFRGGMVSSHGDKTSGYWPVWAMQGIDKYRGSLLYLLTYTKLMDRCKSESEQWVIDNYPVYLPVIEKIEETSLKDNWIKCEAELMSVLSAYL